MFADSNRVSLVDAEIVAGVGKHLVASSWQALRRESMVFPPTLPLNFRPTVTKVLVSLDPGSTYMKACYKVFEEGEVQLPRIGVDRRILFRDVSWPKQHPFTPTKLGLELVPHTDDIVLHWGDQVLTQMQRGTLESETVFWGLKAALFGDDHELSRKDRDRIEKQIGDLPDMLRYSALDEDVTTGSRQLRCEDLYSMYLKQAWRYILLKMKYEYPQLPWTSKSINEDGPLLKDCDIDVECVIPLPADSKPHHINAVVKAAAQAGIPAPYTVLEPAAAYAYDVQDRTENHGPVSHTYCLIVVDMGGASVDLQSWQVVRDQPFEGQ